MRLTTLQPVRFGLQKASSCACAAETQRKEALSVTEIRKPAGPSLIFQILMFLNRKTAKLKAGLLLPTIPCSCYFPMLGFKTAPQPIERCRPHPLWRSKATSRLVGVLGIFVSETRPGFSRNMVI